MDERRTSVNLKECIRSAKNRIAFTILVLDRTGMKFTNVCRSTIKKGDENSNG